MNIYLSDREVRLIRMALMFRSSELACEGSRALEKKELSIGDRIEEQRQWYKMSDDNSQLLKRFND